MVMNLYILFVISLPEAVLNAIIIILFAGAKSKLQINKSNILRFTVSIIAMLAATTIIRPLAQNVIENVLMHTVAYMILFVLIYRLKLGYAALSTILTMLLESTINNIFVPFVIAYISGGPKNFSEHYQFFVVYAMPQRIFQCLVIGFLWKYDILMITKISRRFHKTFIILSSIMVLVEYVYAYMFDTYFDTQPLVYQITNAIILVMLVTVFNLLIFKTIYIAVGDILTKGYSKYKELEENAKSAFARVNTLLKDNRTAEAIMLIDGLNYEDNQK